MPADLRTRVGHLDLPSPILTASGCAGAGRELAQFTDVARIGAVITKSVTLEPRAGNPAPRMAETPSGLLSSVGLQGPGIDGFLQRDLPWLLSRGARVIVSVAAQTVREYAAHGNVVIVGRGAGAILGRRPDVLRVFLYAPRDRRVSSARGRRWRRRRRRRRPCRPR